MEIQYAIQVGGKHRHVSYATTGDAALREYEHRFPRLPGERTVYTAPVFCDGEKGAPECVGCDSPGACELGEVALVSFRSSEVVSKPPPR